MTVVRVRHVGVSVRERVVPVGMRMRLDRLAFVRVLVVGIVHVQMVVLDRLVGVQVLVFRAQQGSDAERHEGCRGQVQGRRPVAQVAAGKY